MIKTEVEGPVSRRRYSRERKARLEAERLLDEKSRALWEANEQLKGQAGALEQTVRERTKELQAAMGRAEASNEAKSIFLASVSHEIRTPLNGVLGMAEALTSTALSAEQTEMAETIVDSGGILLSVLNDILDISKIEAGQLTVESISFDLKDLMNTTLNLYKFKALEKNLDFTIDLCPSAQRWIKSDPVRLRQVTGNLISNAIKFTESGFVRVNVRLRGGPEPELEIAVHDSGPGIPADKLDALFKPFQQLDESINRRHGGTGLGLSISRQICTLMGGNISIESTLGTGSTFVAHVRVQPGEEGAKPAPINVGDSEAFLMGREWKILIAEDNKTNQLVFSKLMQEFPLQITFAEDGRRAIEAFKEEPFDLVLMDINMPIVGGIEATHEIRRFETDSGMAKTPIIALTANSMSHQVSNYLASGMDAHLAKPIRKVNLVLAVADALQPSIA